MDETPHTERPASPTSPVRKRSRTGMMWAFLAVVIAFFAGFFWQFYEAYTVRENLTAVEQELVLERLRVRLGQAALAAQLGEYEAARQQMSAFFNQLQEQSAAIPPDVAGTARNFLAMRDDVITGLSRANPEFADVLYGMLGEFETVMDEAPEPAPEAEEEEEDAVPADGGGG